MIEFFQKLFDSDFMPHGHCYLMRPEIIWLHVTSDALITMAYFSIPITLIYFIRKRRDLPFHWIFVMFGVFIFACGTTHLLEIWSVWHGTYRLSGLVKVVTAIASIGTAIMLVKLIPQALTLPTPTALEKKIEERQRAEAERDRFFNLSLDLLAIAGFDGYFKRLNPAWETTTGCGMSELMNMPYVDLMYPGDRVTVMAELEGLLNGASVRAFEARLRCRDGTYRWTQWNAVSLRGEQLIYAVGRDITDRKQTEEKLLAYQEQLRLLAAKLLMTEERERRRIATEIHDQIGQTLAACKLKLGGLRKSFAADPVAEALVDEIRTLVEQTIRETRSLTFELSPPVLYELGLEEALQWLAEKNQQQHGFLVCCEDDGQHKPLADEVRVLLFRVGRELFINIAKHARARNVRLAVRRAGHEIQIEVEDDGVGFNIAEITPRADGTTGFGLFSIRDRLKYIGGRLEVNSAPGCGTRVLVAAPLTLSDSDEL